jgi:hypothetical protein
MKQHNKFNRLPGYDRTTSRGELVAFLGMALVAAPLLLSALYQSITFSEGKDAIVAALTQPEAPRIALASLGRATNASSLMPAESSRAGLEPRSIPHS